MSRKNYYQYKKTIEELNGPKRDTSGEINPYELERYVQAQMDGVMDMEEILKSRPFTRDELRMVKLIMAKFAYLAGRKITGDQLISEVEASEDKGSSVFQYLEQLKKNKKLYSQKARQHPLDIKILQKVREEKK